MRMMVVMHSMLFLSAVAIYGAECVGNSISAAWKIAKGMASHITHLIFKVACIMVIIMMVTGCILGVLE